MSPKAGSIVHVELHSPDPQKTKQFYADIFGWKFKDVPEMNYILFEAPSEPHGGVMTPMEDLGPMVLNYILTEEIEETARRIERAGGAILVPKSEIPNMGWFAIFRDPAGITQALFQGRKQPRLRAGSRRAKQSGRKARKSSGRRRQHR